MLQVIEGLDRARFDPMLVCVDGLGPLLDEAQAAGVDPIVLGRSFRFDVRGVPRLARLLRRERVSVVHGWMSLPSVFGRLGGAMAGVPVRIAAEGGVLPTTDRNRLRAYAAADRALAPLTSAYVANSEAVAASLREKGVAARKIMVIPNGVAVAEPLGHEDREGMRRELGAGPDDELVGMVARLDPRFKDHDTFLAAIAALSAEGRRIRAVVVGDGPGQPAAERRAAELGITDLVRFTGYRSDAARLVAALDVSVLLSFSEGFSNVLLESMAAGAPVVATDIPPNREAIEDGVHGLLVRVGDVDATAAAVRRLLEDRAFADRMRDAARRHVVADYSLAAQAESTMRLYERLLAEKRVTL